MRLTDKLREFLEVALRLPEARDEMIKAMGSPEAYDFTSGRHTTLDCSMIIDSSGDSTVSGAGIASATKLADGIYQIQLSDNYDSFIQIKSQITSPVGATVAAGSFVPGTLYQILTIGDTDWETAGLNPDFTPAVGMVFVAADIGDEDGTVKVVGTSGASSIELTPGASEMLSPGTGGSVLTIQVLDEAGDLVQPAANSKIDLRITMGTSLF